MPLLIAIDISLSNLMPMGPLTNTQKRILCPAFIYNTREIFFSAVRFIDFPFALHSLHEEAPAAGCLRRLGQRVQTRVGAFRKAGPAPLGLTSKTCRMQNRANVSYLDHGHGGISSSSRWREKHA